MTAALLLLIPAAFYAGHRLAAARASTVHRRALLAERSLHACNRIRLCHRTVALCNKSLDVRMAYMVRTLARLQGMHR